MVLPGALGFFVMVLEGKWIIKEVGKDNGR